MLRCRHRYIRFCKYFFSLLNGNVLCIFFIISNYYGYKCRGPQLKHAYILFSPDNQLTTLTKNSKVLLGLSENKSVDETYMCFNIQGLSIEVQFFISLVLWLGNSKFSRFGCNSFSYI